MREQLSVFISFDTSFEDIQALKSELHTFVLDKENSRDFLADIEVEVVGIAEMNKLELRVQVMHKSNWHNETVRAARRSKFMCALVLALRKIPIYGPGCGEAMLGSESKPTYSVAVSDAEAALAREQFAAAKEAKRLAQAKKSAATGPAEHLSPTGAGQESKAVHDLAARSPTADYARDETWPSNDSSTVGRASMERPEVVEAAKALLHREGTLVGRRRAGSVAVPHQQVPSIAVPQPQRHPSVSYTDHAQRAPPAAAPQTVHPPATSTQMPSGTEPRMPVTGNAFAQQQLRQREEEQHYQREL